MLTAIRSYETIDTGSNLSDHIPSCLIITWSLRHVKNYAPTKSQPKSFKLRWDKADLDEYYRITGILLSKVDHCFGI